MDSSSASGSRHEPGIRVTGDQLQAGPPDFAYGVVILDSDLKIISVDSAAEQMFGYMETDLSGKPLDVLAADPQRFNSEALTDILSDGAEAGLRRGRWTVDGRHQDGHSIPMEVNFIGHHWRQDPVHIYAFRRLAMPRQQDFGETTADDQDVSGTLPALVVRLDSEGRFMYVNQGACRAFGRPAEELLGSYFFSLLDPDDRNGAKTYLQTLADSPHPLTIEQRILTVSGWRWIAWEDQCIREDTSGQYEIHRVGFDISEHKRAEEVALFEGSLAMALAEKSTLADSLPIFLDLVLLIMDMDSGGIYLVDKQSGGLVLKTHKGLSDGFISHSGLIQVGSEQHQLVMQGDPIYEEYLQMQETRNPAFSEERIRSIASIPIVVDGMIVACIYLTSHYRDGIADAQRSRIEGLSCQLGNMIARFLAQEEFRESQEQLQSLFDSLRDFVFVLDSQANIIEVNQVVLDRLGYSSEELLGRSVLNVHPPDRREEARQIISEILAGEIDICLLDLACRDGSVIPVETKVAPARWGNQDALIGISRDITDRNMADFQLREKIDEIEGFFSVSLDLLCIVSLDGDFIRVNKAWEDTLGYDVEELEHSNFLDLVHPEDLPATVAELSRLENGVPVLNFVNRYRSKEGDWRFLEWRSQSRGSLVYAAARDITQRKSAEEIRNRQAALLAYRNAFEAILTSISTLFINLPASRIDYEINQALEQVGVFENVDRCYVFLLDHPGETMNNTHEWCAAGIEPQVEVLKDLPVSIFPWWMEKLKRLEDIHVPVVSEMPPEAQTERDILEAQEIQSVLVVPMHVDNQLIGFLGFDSVAQARNWSPESIKLIKMVSDIISSALMRKQMESNLRNSEAQVRALLSAIPDLIFRLRRDGIFLDYQAGSDALLAAPPDRIIGGSMRDVLGEPVSSQAMVCIEKALETGDVQNLQYDLVINGAKHVYEARFRSSGSDEVIVIVRDISDRARLEQMKTDFINRATHELRTPVATMLMMVNLIDNEPEAEVRAEYWRLMKSELDRERQLIESLLSAGRLESSQTHYHYQPLFMGDLIDRAILTMSPAAQEKNIRMTKESMLAEKGSPQVLGDETALTQALVNLLGNAIRFTPEGGSVTISEERRDSAVCVSIADTGIGIPSEDLPMLFTRFFRASNAIEEEIQGTGLGLFIVHSVLEDHNGKITVSSELGKGSTFNVWLPEYETDTAG